MNAAVKRPEPVAAEEETSKRTKVHVKVRAKFDRAGGMVDGFMVIDKETGMVTVREKGAKKSYSMRLSDVVDTIARRGLFGVRDSGS
jgi:hypothetical protein